MQITYKNRKLERSVKDLVAIKKNYGTQSRRVNKRLEELRAAKNLTDMMNIPQARCHELKQSRKGELAVDVSGNHRIIFIPNHESMPEKKDGGLDWDKVTKIMITQIAVDYH